MGLFDIFNKPKHFCQTPILMKYMQEYMNKSDSELIKLSQNKDTVKAEAAKAVLRQRQKVTNH